MPLFQVSVRMTVIASPYVLLSSFYSRLPTECLAVMSFVVVQVSRIEQLADSVLSSELPSQLSSLVSTRC